MQSLITMRSLMTMQSLVTASLVFAFLFIVFWTVYTAYLSPLSRVPNAHRLAPLTSFWILGNRYRGREFQTVAKAFAKQGPIVRLGPNEIAVNVIEGGIKTVHIGGFHKSQWYNYFINYGIRNTFSSLGNDHAVRRRRVSYIYSKEHLHKSRHVEAITSDVLRACMSEFHRSSSTRTPIDFLSLSFAYSIDFMTGMIFGLPQATNFIQDVEKRKEWLNLYLRSHPSKDMFWMQELPTFTKWSLRIGVPVISRSSQKSREDLESWVLQMADHAEHGLRDIPGEASTALSASGYLPILYHHMKASIIKEDGTNGIAEKQQNCSQRRLELASECLDHIVATRDTFGISMASVLWDITRHRGAQNLLRNELQQCLFEKKRPNQGSAHDMLFLPSPETLDRLPYLNAAIKESLRLRNTVPTSNPRLTPQNRTVRIGTYDGIPGGVRISAFAWCLHRQDEVFERPEEWEPHRWLSDDKARLAEMNKWDWTFGSGSRMCLGKNLALQLIQSTLATIYLNFTTYLLDDKNFGGSGDFVTGKSGDELLIQFEHDEVKYWPSNGKSRGGNSL